MKTICIDPGHGGDDNGASYGFVDEDDINLSIALLLRCELNSIGFDVFLTRKRDNDVSLQQRCEIANSCGADLFISIHCDAFHKETVKGISSHVYAYPSLEAEFAAKQIQASIMAKFPDHTNRGLFYSNFHVLRKTNMPAVLVECEFLSNPETRKFLKKPENQFALAQAILVGVQSV